MKNSAKLGSTILISLLSILFRYMLMTNFSLIIPTYREAKNIPELIHRIACIPFNSSAFEVILVDDNSQDGTIEVVHSLRDHHPWLKLIVRQGKRSLSQAVLEGFQQAQYPILIVMDADLSHPPEKIPEMVTALSIGNADIVIGSRYTPGGSTEEIWPIYRKFISKLSTQLARLLLRTHVSDPLSGFLAIRKTTLLAGYPLEPIGWKIGLEIMVKCSCKKIIEIPICFSQRKHGASKLSAKIAWCYLQHLKRLAWHKLSVKFYYSE
ncbi:MAG: polyprenol monophosphomannose synthase [Gammaproteobacteria bacterium]|nr:MAG: polyprenol monophosphomannose synthase [Gammaproteobacteria bacterium]